jgi:glutamate-1-semialdehyde 2,1-aminomutase
MNDSQKKKTAYRLDTSQSRRLYQQSLKLLPGGNTRHTAIFAPYPVYAKSGNGCRVIDVEGEERIDFINNYTSLILGHSNPKVSKAIRDQIERGSCFGMPTESEIELASLIVERIESIDKLRFCNSGSEAVMLAIKAARAVSGKHKIAKFEGAYHGSYDYAQVSENPLPGEWGDPESPASVAEVSAAPSVKEDVIVMPWNNPKACEAIIEKNKRQLAAVLIDPLPARLGFISPRPGFLEAIRDVARQNHILIIADEVLTFRLSFHGASHSHALAPDITVLGKIIGGGFPIGAVGGSDVVMEVFDHTRNQKVHHGGTFNANPISMRAGLATMRQLTPQAFGQLNLMGDYLRDNLNQLFKRKKLRAQVTGQGSLFFFHPTDRELLDYRSMVHSVKDPSFHNRLAHEMLANGIITSPSLGVGCLSTPMKNEDLDAYINALEISLSSLSW